jgi:F-type H+-transporting ATPase subunit b
MLPLALLLTLVCGLASPGRSALGQDHPEPTHAASPMPGDADPASHDEAEHAPAAKPNILGFEPSLAIFTVIVFFFLLVVLWKFAWAPLAQALEAREHKMQGAFDEAARVRNEAAALLEQHRQQMASAQDQVRAIIEEARRDAQTTADQIMKKAADEAEAAKSRAQREIGFAKDEALTEIWSHSADLAVTIAHKVLDRELSESDHRRLIQAATDHLPAMAGKGGQA